MICNLTKYYPDDQINNETGGARSTYGRQERSIKDFGWRDMRERGHLENLGVNGRIIL